MIEVTPGSDWIGPLEDIAGRLEEAAAEVMESEYSSLSEWGSVLYVRVLVSNVEAALRELSGMCSALTLVPAAGWLAARRGSLYRAQCRLEETRWALRRSLTALPSGRSDSRPPARAITNMIGAVGAAVAQIKSTRETAPVTTLTRRDGGRLVRALARVATELDQAVLAASRAPVQGFGVPAGVSKLVFARARMADAWLAVVAVNMGHAEDVDEGVEAQPTVDDLDRVRDVLRDIPRSLPNFDRVGGEDVAVWLSGRDGPERIAELGDALRSVETMLAALQRGVRERWPGIGDRGARKAGEEIAGGANLLGIAARATSRFATTDGVGVPVALLRWQEAIRMLSTMGERGVGVTCEQAGAELSAAEVQRLFGELATVVLTITPVVSMIGLFGEITGTALLGEREIARLTLELRDAADQLEGLATRIGRE